MAPEHGNKHDQQKDILLQAVETGVPGLVNRKGGGMAEPLLEVDRRLDRIELAIRTMAQWLVQAQTGFGAKDAEGIEKILRGDEPEKRQEDDGDL